MRFVDTKLCHIDKSLYKCNLSICIFTKMPRSKEEQKKYDAGYYQRNKDKIKARKVNGV